ncbi:MAG: hypothetical protein JO101_02720 [Candidatus Eremiobacteraeota bacterium]|nr:hypothetical protein [Candidatus Eremiobacteraeota bacterium]
MKPAGTAVPPGVGDGVALGPGGGPPPPPDGAAVGVAVALEAVGAGVPGVPV